LDATRLSTDTKTGGVHQRHRADLATGMYRGRKIIDIRTPETAEKTSPNKK
jgi:ribosomal protein L32